MKVNRWISRVVTATAVLALSGCATKPTQAPPTSTFVLPSAATALAPALYMQLASSSALFAIRASELALEKTGNAATRSAAQSIIADQGGVGSQLSYAGRRLDLLPSAALTAEQTATLDRLRVSANFDTDFKRTVRDALATSLKAHENFARAGTSPTLKPVAQMAAPVTRKNLDALKR